MRSLNVRLVVILLVGGLVLGGALEGLRRFQVWRKADFYLQQASNAMRRAERARDVGAIGEELAAYDEAVNNYSWYLHLRPGEVKVREELGLLQADLSQVTAASSGPQDTLSKQEETRAKARKSLEMAVFTLESVLREEQGAARTAARRKLVEIYLVNRQYSDARDHLTVLLQKSPDDGELLELLGTCQAALRETNEAAQSLQQAIKSAPDQIDSYRLLAGLLADPNRLNRPALADQWMRKLLEANPKSSRAHMAYGEHLAGLTMVNSIDDAGKRSIFLDAIVPTVLGRAVERGLDALRLEDNDPEALLMAEKKAVLVQAVREALKRHDPKLALDAPDALLLAARREVQVQPPLPEALKQASDQALKALDSEKAPGDHDALLAAAKHGVLVDAMGRALEELHNPNTLLSAAREGLLKESVDHSLEARQLAASGRDALMSLFLREFSSDDHEVIRLAVKRGVLLEAMKRALAAEKRRQEKEVSPTALARLARCAVLLQGVKEVIEGLQLADDERQALSNGQTVLVDLLRHALRDCEPASVDRQVLLQAGENGVLARVAGEALAGRYGILAEAAKDALKTEDAAAVPQSSLSRKVLAGAVKRAVGNSKLAQRDRDVLLLAAQSGVLLDALERVLRDPELASADRNEILSAEGSGTLSRVVKRALQAGERLLENDDLRALLLAAQCGLLRADEVKVATQVLERMPKGSDRDALLAAQRARMKSEYDRARGYADRGIELYPQEYRTYSMAADIAWRTGLQEESLAILQRGLQATQAPQLLWVRGSLLLEAGDIREARSCIKALQKAGYPDSQVGYLQARAEFERGQWLAAVEGRKRKLLFSEKAKGSGGLDAGIVSRSLRPAFESRKISLSSDPLVQTEAEDRLIIIDESAVYEVTRQGDVLNVYQEATRGFAEIRGGLASSPALLKQADYWTGRCYGQLENLDLELRAYRRALDVDPFYIPAKIGLTAALARSGQIDLALKEHRQIMGMGVTSESGWLPLGRLLLDKNRRLPPPERNWQEVEQVLDSVQQIDPGSLQLVLSRAELLVAQAGEKRFLARQQGSPVEQQKTAAEAQQLFDRAEQLIGQARDKNPQQTELWAALARLAQHKADWDRAAALLDEAEQKLSDSVTLRLARASYLADRYGPEARDKLRQLAENTEQFSEAQRLQLWNGLLSASGQVGDDERFQELCRRVAEKDPNNLGVRRLRLELAFRSRNDAGIKETLQDVERIEGQGPLWHYGQAVRLSLPATSPSDKRLDEALQHLALARKSRPSWSRIPLVAATIYDQQSKITEALDSYLEAIKMGEYGPVGVRRAVELLYHEQRFPEADRLLGMFEEIPPELLETAAWIDLGLGRFDQALDKARRNAADSKNYRDHLWLGQLLTEKGRRALAEGQTGESKDLFSEAEESLRRALKLADQVPEAWVAMIQFLAGTGQTEKAEQAIEEARSKIPADQRSLALAQSYERMGRPELAEQNYEEALAAAPEDPAIARYVADFYLRKGGDLRSDLVQQSEAVLRCEAILKRIISGEVKGKQADVVWARRRLALIFLGRFGSEQKYDDLQQALGLIEGNLAQAGPNVEDLRYKARILAVDGDSEKRNEAMRILESLPGQQRSASPEDRFVLWQLYLAQGAWARASAEMRSLLATHGDRPMYVAAYISALLKRNQPDEAELWLKRLEAIGPDWFSPGDLATTTGFRAELLFQRKEYVPALDLMNRFVGNSATQPSDEAERSRLVALVLEQFARRLRELGQADMAKRFGYDAETLCRKYVRQRPGQEAFLVAFLGRQNRIEEALNVLDSTWVDSDPAATAEASMILLTNPAATAGQLQRVENKVVRPALEKFGRPIPLLLVMAQACALQRRYGEAETFYREVIKKNSGSYQAMNNLAVLLALQGAKLQEALKLVNRAIELAGSAGVLLDSRASVYMALGQPRKALDDLKKSITQQATPVRHFHQARAYQQNGQPQAAIEAMEEARRLGLKPEMLEPLERPAYQALLKLLK